MHLDHDTDHLGAAGHNSARPVSQWQTPHLPDSRSQTATSAGEPDTDLVEDAFVEAFPRAPDPTSFLRLAGVPLIGQTADGRRCCLLRVEISQKTDIGSLSPYLGGAGHRYDPLPAKMASRRQAVTLVYFDGEKSLHLSLNEARGLKHPQEMP
jgi:hypothetical protein